MENTLTATATISIKAPVHKVWMALTDPELIKQYFFGTDTKSDWKVGSPITFSGEWEGKSYEDKGTILEFEENRKLKYSYWSSMSGTEDKPENYADITYEVTSSGDRTEIKVTQEHVRDEATKVHSEQNWNMVLQSLKKMLEEN